VETTLNTRAAVQSRRGVFWIVLAAVLWGTVGIASNALFRLAPTEPLSIGFLRMAIAAPVLLGAGWALLGRRIFAVTWRDAGLILLIGATMAAYQALFFAAIAQVGVAIAVLVTLCSAPMLVALLAGVFLRERLTRQVVLALLCALGGTGLLVGGGSSVSGGGLQTLGGVLLALGSSLGFALMTLCSRALAGRSHPVQPMAWGLTASALFLLPFVLAFGLTLSYPLQGWLLLLYLGIVPTALAFVIFLIGMRYVIATTASIVTMLEPLTSTVLAWLLFGERLSALGFVGGALLIGAILVLARRV
jgi:DME family drug/metabolite transporter